MRAANGCAAKPPRPQQQVGHEAGSSADRARTPDRGRARPRRFRSRPRDADRRARSEHAGGRTGAAAGARRSRPFPRAQRRKTDARLAARCDRNRAATAAAPAAGTVGSSRRTDRRGRVQPGAVAESARRTRRQTRRTPRGGTQTRRRAPRARNGRTAGARTRSRKRGQHAEAVEAVRSTLETARVDRQGLHVKRGSLVEQLEATGLALDAGRAKRCRPRRPRRRGREQLERIANRIQRLGPINLAAIEEFESSSERKQYLDQQHGDLTEALETLGNAIRRIDRETRTRFKETFDAVNKGLGERVCEGIRRRPCVSRTDRRRPARYRRHADGAARRVNATRASTCCPAAKKR